MNTIYSRAEDYDLQYSDYDRDIPFMLRLAEIYAGKIKPIAEYACGTLRVSIPLARKYFEVDGVDLSPEMLALGRKKLGEERMTVSNKMLLFTGDMTDHKLPNHGNYRLSLVPFTAFLHLTTKEMQIKALRNMWDGLYEGGRLMVDIFNPSVIRLSQGIRVSNPIVEKQIPILDGTQTLVRSVSSAYHASTQLLNWYFFVSIYSRPEGDLIRSYREEATVRVIFPNEWRLLLEMAGFEIEEEWGDYNFSPFSDDSPRMLFLARKPSQ